MKAARYENIIFIDISFLRKKKNTSVITRLLKEIENFRNGLPEIKKIHSTK